MKSLARSAMKVIKRIDRSKAVSLLRFATAVHDAFQLTSSRLNRARPADQP
jgi:hypothetical protein